MEVVSEILGIIIISYSHIYSWYCLEKKKINYKDYKFFIVLVLFVILLMFSVSIVDKFIKIACTTIISILLNYYLMRENIKKTILMPVITQIIIMISETFLMICLALLGADIDNIISNIFGSFAINTSVAIIVILIQLFVSVIPEIYQVTVNKTSKVSSGYFIVFSFIAIVVANVLVMTVYYKIDFKYLLVFNTLITVAY
ncbi:MAG: hypothetical protein HFH09_00580, partial [Bacilli bacterium]|nr:hypothetical protein [Bacilli bacterium]